VPINLLKLMSKIPYFGNKKMAQQAQLVNKLANNMEAVAGAYQHFFLNTWKFDDKEYLKVCNSLNATDAEEFLMDLRKVDLIREGKIYPHGLAKYFMLDDIPAINQDFR